MLFKNDVKVQIFDITVYNVLELLTDYKRLHTGSIKETLDPPPFRLQSL